MRAKTLLAILPLLIISCNKKAPMPTLPEENLVVVAYVTSWSSVMPDPTLMTHINYAFGHVKNTFNGVRIDNEKRLKKIVALKKQNPNLKVMLSIGGWGSGGFSEMAASDTYRKLFAADCKRVVDKLNLDGIDIDWEYPTRDVAGISASPADQKNFTLLMRDLREALGNDKYLTIATISSADYINFREIMSYVNFVNIMAYDMASAPKHHSPLYPSENTTWMTGDDAVDAHLSAGVPASQLVLGMPFYGRGGDLYKKTQPYKDIEPIPDGYRAMWDSAAMVPYLVDENGTFVFGYENVKSISMKCQYILDRKLRGGMYWEYDDDNDQRDLSRTLADYLIGKTLN